MDELITEFLTETAEGIAELDVALVRLERTPDDAPTLALVFRLMHTIKGTCGFLGLTRLQYVAHAAEEVLGQVREGKLAAGPDLVSAVLTALDRIKLIIAGLSASGSEPAGDDAAIIGRLTAIAEGRTANPAAVAIAEIVVETQPAEAGPAEIKQAEVKPAEIKVQTATSAAPQVAPQVAPQAAAELVAATQTIRVAVEVLET